MNKQPFNPRQTRRRFLANATLGSAALVPLAAQNYSDYTKDPRPDVPEGAWTAGEADGPVFLGSPVVSGPDPHSIAILQPVRRLATAYLEYSIEAGPWQKVDGDSAGLMPLSEHVLKFNLPPLPGGKRVRYRIVARAAGWVKVRQFYHGEFKAGEPQVSPERSFLTLDPDAQETTFIVWNDTHENSETLQALASRTIPLKPDFLLWNGDQSNDIHFERDMARQFLNPEGLTIADQWPLAYVRGNHDVRGPAARSLPNFTGTPGDRFYYGFRSGPLATLVMDTGEDKPDSNPYLAGMGAFEKMQRQQAEWLQNIIQEPWFREAPHKILFCHIPLWYKNPRNPKSDGSKFCRDLWAGTLQKAGVKLIVSGHTHNPLWMPAQEDQPIAQLIGGGPQASSATLIHGIATRDSLSLTMSKLDGKTLTTIVL